MTQIVKEHIIFHYLLTKIKNLALYFDSSGIEYISLEVLDKIINKSIIHNLFRVQGNESFMCRFYCIAFIEYCNCSNLTRLLINADKLFWAKSCNLFILIINVACKFDVFSFL